MRQFAKVFVSRSADTAIVVTMHANEADIWFEDETPVVLSGPLVAADLGNRVRDAMGATSRRSKDLSRHKLTDWPAFRASGASSVKRFQSLFIPIGVMSANESNLIAEVSGLPAADSDLHVVSHVSTSLPAEVGEAVIRVYEACRDRRV